MTLNANYREERRLTSHSLLSFLLLAASIVITTLTPGLAQENDSLPLDTGSVEKASPEKENAETPAKPEPAEIERITEEMVNLDFDQSHYLRGLSKAGLPTSDIALQQTGSQFAGVIADELPAAHLPLVSLNLPPDAPTRNDTVEADQNYLRRLWHVSEITDPTIREFAELLIRRRAENFSFISREMHGHLFDYLAAHPLKNPQFTAGAIGYLPRADSRGFAPQLLARLDELNEPVLAYQVAAFQIDGDHSEEETRDALRRLYTVLFLPDRADGSGDDKFLIGNCIEEGGLLRYEPEITRTMLQSHPKVPEWFTLALSGKKNIRMAWRSRGGSWAKDVTESGWKGFERHLRQADRDLRRSWELHPHHPWVPAQMITVSKGLSGDLSECRKWFDRAISIQADYLFAYHRYIDCLRPRWLGSIAHLHRFGESCAHWKRYDTAVPRLLRECHDLAGEDFPADLQSHYWSLMRQEDIRLLEEMYEGYRQSTIHPSVIEHHDVELGFIRLSRGKTREAWELIEGARLSYLDSARKVMPLNHEMYRLLRTVEVADASGAGN